MTTHHKERDVSEYFQDSGHHWWRKCDYCQGAFPSSPPPKGVEPAAWECEACVAVTTHRAEQAERFTSLERQVKALADALAYSGCLNEHGWHTWSCHHTRAGRGPCLQECVETQAALRMAKRLP